MAWDRLCSMSDIELVVTALQEHGTGAAATVAGLWAARRIAGPSLDAIGTRFANLTTYQLENLAKIFSKAEAADPEAVGYPHPRVAHRVLNDASLYDDNVMQTYTAGLVAGSRNDDGSDDRPIYYLGLMDSLTAGQLALFHSLYDGALKAGPPVTHGVASGAHVAIHLDQVKTAMAALGEGGAKLSEASRFLTPPLSALHYAGLIIDDGTDKVDGAHTLVTYWTTRAGMLLFDWAHGHDDEDLASFYERDRSRMDLPSLRLDTARLV